MKICHNFGSALRLCGIAILLLFMFGIGLIVTCLRGNLLGCTVVGIGFTIYCVALAVIGILALAKIELPTRPGE